MPHSAIFKKLTKDEMQNYQEAEVYRGFSIMMFIAETATEWRVSARIGDA